MVIGPSGSGKTQLLRSLADENGWPLLPLGSELSRRILPLTVRQRELKTADTIADMIQEMESECVLVDNTEIVFDPALRLNVDGLLSTLCRNTVLVWTWQGKLQNGMAVHATNGHPEHRAIPVTDFTVIEMTPAGE
jgi:hypothetical protein